MGSENTTHPNVALAPEHRSALVYFLALLSMGAAYALAPFVNDKPLVLGAAVVFPIFLIALLGVPAFQCLPFGSRALLALLALRPLVDLSQAFQTVSAGGSLVSTSGLSLQEGFAALFILLLLGVWIREGHHRLLTNVPNILLTALLGFTSVSWVIGGLSEGVRGFARTAWGLAVALLLGSLFRSARQVDIFVRTVFYSSILILITLGASLGRGFAGTASDPLWRLGGQYGTPNALAGVALSFFLYGLYTIGRARTPLDKLLSLSLLLLLSAVIVSTQSRTVGALMLMSVCIFLWASRRRRLLFALTVPLLFFLFLSTAGTRWRLISSFFTNKEIDPDVLTLQGRVLLWGEWMKNYMDANLFHKLFGLGWGVMLHDFLAMAFPTASVTESSFLWFLVGTGGLGLLTFCAYLLWVFFKSWSAWRRASSDFEKQFALLAFLAVICFVIEGFTTDVASAPNADVYIFAILSIFAFQYLRRNGWLRSMDGVYRTPGLN
jgi:hypothetical protein